MLKGKCEGRKSHRETNPELVKQAKRLTGKARTLREIAAELEALGFVNERGVRFHPESVRAMLA